jgi:opacity protein-like surface antigen
MKSMLTAVVMLLLLIASAQTVPAKQPVESHYDIGYGWWILGVLLAVGVGIGVYMLIKKDPRRDAMR